MYAHWSVRKEWIFLTLSRQNDAVGLDLKKKDAGGAWLPASLSNLYCEW